MPNERAGDPGNRADLVEAAGPGSVDGRHLLLVGAGPGLGMAVARRFAVGGYQVTLVARSTEGLRDLAGTVADTGGKINTIAADASDPDGLGARTCHRALMAVLSMTGSGAAAVTWPYGRRL